MAPYSCFSAEMSIVK